MAQITKVKTGSPLEKVASYSRVVAVDNWIFVSNTAGRDPQTKQMSDDVFEQVDQVFRNIEAALASVDACLADVVTSKVFIKQPENVASVMEHIGGKFKDIDPTTTVTCPPLGSSIYEVELEVTAYRGAASSPVKTIHIGAQG